MTKIYVSRPERAQWEETGLVGVWTFFAHEPTKTLYLQLLDLQVSFLSLPFILAVVTGCWSDVPRFFSYQLQWCFLF